MKLNALVICALYFIFLKMYLSVRLIRLQMSIKSNVNVIVHDR